MYDHEACMPYVLMILKQLCLAILLALVQSVVNPSHGVSAAVLVVYEQLISALVISSLALLFERGKMKKPSFQIVCWAAFVGFLQITMGELMLTTSLRYITATFESVSFNTIPALVFLLAVVSRRERFNIWDITGQLKLWGILASAGGATVVVILSGKTAVKDSTLLGAAESQLIGCLMVGFAVMAVAVANLLVERMALEYPAHLTLSALMNVFGTLQTVIIATLIERNPSSWRIWRAGSLPIFTLLYAGIVVNGLFYIIHNWCIHKKGPVFATSFSPLCILFSFLLETLVLGGVVHPWSITGAVLVVGGLYLLLWAKSKDYKAKIIDEEVQKHLIDEEVQKHFIDGSHTEPLLSNKV